MLAGALAGISETDSVGSDTFSDWETGAGGLSTAVWYGLSSCLFGTVKMVPDSEVLSFPPPDLEAFLSVVFVGGAVGVPLGGTVGEPVGGSAGVFVGGIVGASVGGAADVFVGGTVGVPLGGAVGVFVGGAVGASVGGAVGASVGGIVGASVGGTVGASVVGSVGLESGLSPSSFLSNNPSGGFSNRFPPPRSPPISVEYSNRPVAALWVTVT